MGLARDGPTRLGYTLWAFHAKDLHAMGLARDGPYTLWSYTVWSYTL